jgi:hypothetical protein
MEGTTDRTIELLGVDLQTLMEVFGRRLAFVQVYAVTADGPRPPAIVADMGDPEQAVEIIRKIEQRLGSNDEYEVRSPDGEYKSASFASIRYSESNLMVRYALLDNLFVLALDQDTFEAILDVHLGEDPPLVYDPKFNKTRAGVSADGELFVYMNMELIWPIFWQMSHPDQNMLLQILGVDEIKSLAWTMDLMDAARSRELYMYTGASHSVLTSLLTEHDPLLSPHLIPITDADMFLAMNLGDLSAVWDKLMDSMRSVIGEENYAQMQGDITEFEQGTTLNLRDDIFSSLTGEVGIAMRVPDVRDLGMIKDSPVIFCGVRDSEQCAMSIGKILSQRGGQTRQVGYGSATVYLLDDSENPPGYTFTDDMLIFARVQSLKHIIDGEPPLAVSEKFAWINSRLAQRPGLMYYMDLEKVGEMLLTASPRAGAGDDVLHLQKLGSTGGILIHDGEGLKINSVGTPGVSWLETIGDLLELFVS